MNRIRATRAPRVAIVLALALWGCGDDATTGMDTASPPADTHVAETTPTDTTGETTPVDVEDGDVANAEVVQDMVDVPDGVDAPEISRPDTEDVGDVDPDAPTLCAPPLAFDAAEHWVFPFGVVDFTATGGTGDYRFELIEDNSGALLQPVSGSYIAGSVNGVTDRVRLYDLGCVGEDFSQVHLATPMTVHPGGIELSRGESFNFSVEAGSGSVLYALTRNDSGASLDESGFYTAGQLLGSDQVTVTDILTGQVELVSIEVVQVATLSLRMPVVYVPVGHTYRPRITGGSGEFDGAASSDGLAWHDDSWRVNQAGTYDGRLVDRHTGKVITQTVIGLAAQANPIARTGTNSWMWDTESPGDINGDGWPDTILSVAEANTAGVQSGAVYIYKGGPTGPEAAPARVIDGNERRGLFGRSIAVGDVDNDGLVDLVVGAARDDVGASDSGAVYVYPGVPGGFFSQSPSRVYGGDFGGDWFGYSVAVCDFNGDGYDDLASAMWLGEDRAASPVSSNQGAIHIYLGNATGLALEASERIYGQRPDGAGGWEYINDMRLGGALAAADFDGDGACDLAAASNYYDGGRGVVLVFAGIAAQGADPGGIMSVPSRGWWANREGFQGSQMGWFLAAGDVTGDDKAELLISQGYLTSVAGANNRRGAARLILGGAWVDDVATEIGTDEDADWSVYGDANSDYYGYQVHIGDATGDGLADVVLGNWFDEAGCVDCPNNAGTVSIYEARTGMLPDTVAARVINGAFASDRFGTALQTIGDVDADGVPDLMLVGAANDDLGGDVGRPYVTSWDAGLERDVLRGLDMPGQPGGWKVGQSVAIIDDIDGDGYNELAVGAPDQEAVRASGDHVNVAGSVQIYRGTTGGFETEPLQTLGNFVSGHGGYDRLGYAMDGLDDFDGDGKGELAVVVRHDDRPNSFNANWVPEPSCVDGSRGNSGSVMIFSPDGEGRLQSEPAFVRHGPQASQNIDSVSSAGDINGDGLADLVYGGRSWDRPGANNVGGFEIVFGRPRLDPTKPTVICAADFSFLGLAANDNGGSALTELGDVDSDGCDDFAYGSYLEDLGISNQGTVRIIFGFGPNCASAAPRALTFNAGVANAWLGWSLDGGVDLDGDGKNEMIVGARDFRVGSNPAGAVALVDGARLAALSGLAEPIVDGQPPTNPQLLVVDALGGALLKVGEETNQRLGMAVALIPSLGPTESPAVAMLSQRHSDVGVENISLVEVFGVLRDGAGRLAGLTAEPLTVIGGESDNPVAATEAAMRATVQNNRGVLVFGLTDSHGLALDSGAAYCADLSPLEAP